MLIKPPALSHWIKNFYGYGSWQAPVWFVAFEESGGDVPEEVAEKLDYFFDSYSDAADPTLCDIRDMYRRVSINWEGSKANLFENRYAYRFGEKAVRNKVWENLIAFNSGYYNREVPDLLGYQRELFASASSREALIKLFPLPGANHHGWNYNWLDLPDEFGFLKSRALYQDRVYENRMRGILDKVSTYRPSVVLMYGMNMINTLKESISDCFGGVKFSQVKAIRQHIPQHHRARVFDTEIVITTQIPTLRHNRVETGFDWQAFGRAIGGSIR